MKIFKNIEEFIQERKVIKDSVGFVPTMGALHRGHLSLLEESKKQCAISVLSIFVNPTQFNDKKDFEKYPITLEQDLKLAQDSGVDYVILPTFEQIYPDHYKYKISENDFSLKLCGASRPGHFDGVLTIVMKLLNIISPQKAFFGEKDFQQLSLIQNMVRAFFLPVEIVSVKTFRESDGLAMSSRNVRLSSEGRKLAPIIYKIISEEKTAEEAKHKLQNKGIKVDYVEDLLGRRFVAAFIEDVRLIDNVKLN